MLYFFSTLKDGSDVVDAVDVTMLPVTKTLTIEPSLSVLEKFRHQSDLLYIKCNFTVLSLR